MSPFSWGQLLKRIRQTYRRAGSSTLRRGNGRRGPPLCIEVLEDRTVPAGLTVQSSFLDTTLAYPGEQINVSVDVLNSGTAAVSNVQVRYSM